MGIEERIDGSKSWSERAAERVPGCRGYKDRELRHETDKLERRCLAERLDGARGALQEVQRDLSRQGGLDLLGVIDNAACKLGVIRDRVEFADYGCAGFFDITEVGEQSRKTASHPQCGDDPRPCDHNRQGWFVPQLWRRARTSRQGLVRCRYCGTEIYLSPAVVSPTGFEPGISAGEPRGEAGDLGDLSPPDEGMRS
jgi:hypothetical protein